MKGPNETPSFALPWIITVWVKVDELQKSDIVTFLREISTLRKNISVPCKISAQRSYCYHEFSRMATPGRFPSKQQFLMQLRHTWLTATSGCCNIPLLEISQSVGNKTTFSASTMCCYVLRIHWRTTREQGSNNRIEDSLQGEEKALTRETRGHTQVTCI